MACSKQRVPQTNKSPGGVLFAIIFDLILIFLIMGLGIPVTSHFLVNDERSPLIVRITHLAWKIVEASSRHMTDSSIQNRLLFEGLEFGTRKFTWNGR